MKPPSQLETLLKEIRACRLCEGHLPSGPRPVLRASRTDRLLIVGQAPGRRVHETGIPFNDPSGNRLRDWLGIDRETFYDENQIAILPMGFCYPGTGKSGDLPPRPECAEAWREKLLSHLGKIELTLAIGQYAIGWHLGDRAKRTLTETVRDWRSHWPTLVPMPHPSPRNNLWLRRNPWFEEEMIPAVRARVRDIIAKGTVQNRRLNVKPTNGPAS
jgi:uracil-DNA glycosylase